MKILQLQYKLPFPIYDGGAHSIYYATKALQAQGHSVKVLSMYKPEQDDMLHKIPPDYLQSTRFESVCVNTRVKAIPAFLNLIGGQCYFHTRFFSKKYAQKLINSLIHNNYDVIQLEHVYLCQYISLIRKYSQAKIVLRTQNIENELWQTVTQNTSNPIKKNYLAINTARLKRFELKNYNRVDGIIALTEHDANYIKKHNPAVEVSTIPLATHTNDHAMPSYDASIALGIYHLGSMDWEPNLQGIRWFIQDVMPILKKRFANIKVHLAGKHMPKWLYQYADHNLIVDGQVENAEEYHKSKSVMIVPLLSGGGMRVKIIEGMALGKTIVSTSLGATGIPYKNGENILIADDATTFANQLANCITTPWIVQSIGKNALQTVKATHALPVIGQKMTHFYKQLYTL